MYVIDRVFPSGYCAYNTLSKGLCYLDDCMYPKNLMLLVYLVNCIKDEDAV